MKIITIDEVKARIDKRFPNEKYKIIEYTKMTKSFTIQCLKCGQIKTYFSCSNFLSQGKSTKKHLCECYTLNNLQYRHNLNQRKILDLCNNKEEIEFLNFSYREKTKKYSVNILCHNCNQIFNKDWASFLNNQNCPFCYSRHNFNTKGFKAILPQEYTLLNEYTGTENKVLIKHECGFVWNIKPHQFIQKINSGYQGCPQCNHKRSQGELKIAKYLQESNIVFIEEQIFLWSSNSKFRYDFYLPKYNLIIEYMGQQHYKEIDFFHDTLEERKEHDKIKEREAKEHGLNYLVIPYTEFKNINNILQNWFNDYSERK